MRHVRRHREKPDGPDLTPSLDVVFILLIFFIVTATFVEEQTLSMEPPMEGPPTRDAQSIVVQLDADGLVSVNGRLTDISFVQANIERLKAEVPDSQLVIQAAPTAKSGTLLLVRDAAYGAGFDRNVGVSLLAENS